MLLFVIKIHKTSQFENPVSPASGPNVGVEFGDECLAAATTTKKSDTRRATGKELMEND